MVSTSTEPCAGMIRIPYIPMHRSAFLFSVSLIHNGIDLLCLVRQFTSLLRNSNRRAASFSLGNNDSSIYESIYRPFG